ncbi:hypothetical protein BABINDRAFT_161488 [Babjeviella inositovora NRRL Y-12698]|uniref:Uncharacterized protein n=1 Tax=Babjeviella inositovora NRRL Y-12698 TaxID=984486 RepID=A0A1E3QQL3_9ASCO|nr:uncharacterized protein BABINDRAFT_161488 [Babjeviella inositovora NRRL Y-12698]ODQ79794.1 hypothetical protein BABINDRAFT_161488 [Babjeviella inositovora NRRL Y-12698]
MIILPNTPPIPRSVPLLKTSGLPGLVNSVRLLLCDAASGQAIKYAGLLEDYLVELFSEANKRADTPAEVLNFMREAIFVEGTAKPWSGIGASRPEHRGQSWYVIDEVETVFTTLALVYMKIAGDAMATMIQIPGSIEDTWKHISGYFKRALSFLKYVSANRIHKDTSLAGLSPAFVSFLQHLVMASLQLSILSKSLTTQIQQASEAFTSTKPTSYGLFSRVALFVSDELTICEKLLSSLPESSDFAVWPKYLARTKLYVNAYAGYYLSVEKYHQNAIGEAIGLVNYGIYQLEQEKSKPSAELYETETSDVKELGNSLMKTKLSLKTKLQTKLQASKDKKTAKKIDGLTSVSVLTKNSVLFFAKYFPANSALMLDLTNLYHSLIAINAKYTKENLVLKYDTVPSYAEIVGNSAKYWPSGRQVPVNVEDWHPVTNLGEEEEGTDGYAGKGAYY